MEKEEARRKELEAAERLRQRESIQLLTLDDLLDDDDDESSIDGDKEAAKQAE